MKARQLWIARDMNGNLHIFIGKPELKEMNEDTWCEGHWVRVRWFCGTAIANLRPWLFKEITFENSPQKISVTINLA